MSDNKSFFIYMAKLKKENKELKAQLAACIVVMSSIRNQVVVDDLGGSIGYVIAAQPAWTSIEEVLKSLAKPAHFDAAILKTAIELSTLIKKYKTLKIEDDFLEVAKLSMILSCCQDDLVKAVTAKEDKQ